MKHKVSVSILKTDFAELGKTADALRDSGADWLHFDVMDGVFVPNLTFGMKTVADLRKRSPMFFDVHLMIERPGKYVRAFAESGADLITFHVEATDKVSETIALIRSCGKKVGISVNALTPVEEVFPYVDEADMVLVMTVQAGFGGQKLIPETVEKIKKLRERYPDLLIEADGGITRENVGMLAQAGVDVFVAGSSVTDAEDMASAIRALRAAV